MCLSLSKQSKCENPWHLKCVFYKYNSYEVLVFLQQCKSKLSLTFYRNFVERISALHSNSLDSAVDILRESNVSALVVSNQINGETLASSCTLFSNLLSFVMALWAFLNENGLSLALILWGKITRIFDFFEQTSCEKSFFDIDTSW